MGIDGATRRGDLHMRRLLQGSDRNSAIQGAFGEDLANTGSLNATHNGFSNTWTYTW